ncbi:CYTH and CHAD domain-containing protein [Actinoplanes utahensis]|uniref:CHAD domain containing protein n=1 Tax=Actinoplanes utahensis TaxID=1869 RepID=A0A0A6US61_ACTUT|nr:CYTH and CHAD domain-containing protein [Actinoplanes utahensis]KHD78975.1 CHAD domain containing protein [Actinoplanes utahensis]GIF28040.1 CHAD domain-containing protein [Actinoplanes utahensis]
MEIATETERKYDVPETFELPDLIGAGEVAGVDGAETHDLDATYFDTDDLLLMRNRRTLRKRGGGHDAGWHLKTPGDGSGRTEHRLNGDSESVPEELTRLVRAIVRRHPLGPVARLRTHRVETPLRDADGRTLALVAQDQVRAESDGDESAWQEIEVELVDGDPAVLDAVERRLFDAGARPAQGPSKVSRALAGRLAEASRGKKTKGRINPVLRYAREQRDAIIEHDPGARRGEPRSVHQMRVATRRLRSTLKTYRRSFGESDLRDELRWLAGVLGAVRDPQVLEEKLLALVEAAGPEFAAAEQRVRAHLEHRIETGRTELAEALDSDRYLDLLDRVDELVDRDRLDTPDPVKRARKVLAKADVRLDAALASGVEEDIHESRKGFKQARYAVELIAPDHGKPAKELVKALTGLQDGLGAYQDSNVARSVLRELGADSFHFGVLYGRQEQVGREALAEVPKLARWARRRKVRRLF